MIGGLAALPVALASEAHPIARGGFLVQAIVWLALAASAVVAIRAGDVARHRRLMLGVATVASGAIWLRLVIAATVATGWPFAPTYAAAAWLCWLVPLGLVATVGQRDRPKFASFVR